MNSPQPRGNRPAVFLDRDGTIIEEVGYVNHLERVRLYPWSAEAIGKVNRAGVPVIAVTNQSGVARGYFTEELVRQVHEEIARELALRQARVDAFYFCPHHPNARLEAYRVDCQCRKPRIGMLEQAVKEFAIDLAQSYVVGDSYRDMEFGFNAGARTILVMTGYGRGEYEFQRSRWPLQPDHVAENLLAAVEIILGERSARPPTLSGLRRAGPPEPLRGERASPPEPLRRRRASGAVAARAGEGSDRR